jgi:hypothetical protein
MQVEQPTLLSNILFNIDAGYNKEKLLAVHVLSLV